MTTTTQQTPREILITLASLETQEEVDAGLARYSDDFLEELDAELARFDLEAYGWDGARRVRHGLMGPVY